MTTPAALADLALREAYGLFWDLGFPLVIHRTNAPLVERILARAARKPEDREALFAALEASSLWDVIDDAGKAGPERFYEPTHDVCLALATRGIEAVESQPREKLAA